MPLSNTAQETSKATVFTGDYVLAKFNEALDEGWHSGALGCGGDTVLFLIRAQAQQGTLVQEREPVREHEAVMPDSTDASAARIENREDTVAKSECVHVERQVEEAGTRRGNPLNFVRPGGREDDEGLDQALAFLNSVAHKTWRSEKRPSPGHGWKKGTSG